ncbi:hypothetical protein Tco_0943824 [Tanacetum coccineum]
MDDPNITMEEYFRLEEEKARRRAIVFNDMLTFKEALSCEPTVSFLNDEIDFRISFDESDDEDCTTNTPYLKTLKDSRSLPDFEEYAIDTPYMILWSKIKKNTFSANTLYPKTSILRIGQYSVSKKSDMAYWSIRRIQKLDTAYPNSCARILEYFILGAHAKSSNTPY